MCVYCLHPFQSNGEKVKDESIKFQAFLSQLNDPSIEIFWLLNISNNEAVVFIFI